jgi:hypothetical protein
MKAISGTMSDFYNASFYNSLIAQYLFSLSTIFAATRFNYHLLSYGKNRQGAIFSWWSGGSGRTLVSAVTNSRTIGHPLGKMLSSMRSSDWRMKGLTMTKLEKTITYVLSSVNSRLWGIIGKMVTNRMF